jgi:hypothetical protein
MTLFNMVGAFLAALLAFSVVLYIAVVGGVLAYHKTLEALRHLRSKRARLAAGRQADWTDVFSIASFVASTDRRERIPHKSSAIDRRTAARAKLRQAIIALSCAVSFAHQLGLCFRTATPR